MGGSLGTSRNIAKLSRIHPHGGYSKPLLYKLGTLAVRDHEQTRNERLSFLRTAGRSRIAWSMSGFVHDIGTDIVAGHDNDQF